MRKYAKKKKFPQNILIDVHICFKNLLQQNWEATNKNYALMLIKSHIFVIKSFQNVFSHKLECFGNFSYFSDIMCIFPSF
jgi:hypothetical protein